MGNVSKEELARKAAKWWREAYERPRFDNGDQSAGGGLAMMMAMMLSDRPSDDVADKFEEELYTRILDKISNTTYSICIGVDYGPDKILSDACEASGMSVNNSPWKTNMTIDQDSVSVSAGYGASYKRI